MPDFGVRRFIGKNLKVNFYGRRRLSDFYQTLTDGTANGSEKPEGYLTVYGVGRGGFPYGGGRGHCYGGSSSRKRGNRW